MPALAKFVKKIASLFAEKPKPESNDFEVEHFLIYHGLVGGNTRNERKFKDVKADLELAWRNKSSAQLAVVLKQPPLWWEDKLKSIVNDLDDQATLVEMLAAEPRDDSFETTDAPLFHEDWHVRANAALLLGHLNATDKDEILGRSLDDTATNTKMAFPYQALALAKLDTDKAREALERHLLHDEPWIRVDAARAISLCRAPFESEALLRAIISRHRLSDYTAVLIAKQVNPELISELLGSGDRLKETAASAIIAGSVEGASKTFPAETIPESGIPAHLEAVSSIAREKSNLQAALASYELSKWLEDNYSYTLMEPAPEGLAAETLNWIQSTEFKSSLQKRLTELQTGDWKNDPLLQCELRAGILLAAATKLEEAAPFLSEVARERGPLSDDSIDSLGLIGGAKEAELLVALAETLVDVKERALQPKSAQPVLEEKPIEADSYWRIIRALGHIPYEDSLNFLLTAADDFAPDKRTEALKSATSIAKAMMESDPESRDRVMAKIKDKAADALGDSSTQMKKEGLNAVRELAIRDQMKRIVGLTSAKETSLVKEAFNTLSELSEKGHTDAVLKALEQGLKTETDIHRRQKLKEAIERLT